MPGRDVYVTKRQKEVRKKVQNVKFKSFPRAYRGVQIFLVSLLVILGIVLALPARTYAIWPFDAFSKSNSATSQVKFPTLIQRVIDKFKLNSGEVEEVVKEVQTERQQEMRARREAKLEEAVKAGVITSEQKKTLLDKEDEWRQKQQQQMQERLEWVKDSGINFEKLAPYGGLGFGGRGFEGKGFGKGHGFGGW